MLIRIVIMTIEDDRCDDFEAAFSSVRQHISDFEGCIQLRMLRGTDEPSVYTTLSTWTGKDALERYRQSDLFKKTWATVKPMFAARAVAYSYEEL